LLHTIVFRTIDSEEDKLDLRIGVHPRLDEIPHNVMIPVELGLPRVAALTFPIKLEVEPVGCFQNARFVRHQSKTDFLSMYCSSVFSVFPRE
jgi:hypothetical protein